VSFWKKTKFKPTEPVKYFPGSVVKTEKGYYYIQEKSRLLIPNRRVLESWAFPRIAESTEAAVAHYPVVAKLGFRDGTVIFDLGTGVYYYIAKGKAHLITSPDTMTLHNITADSVIVVSHEDTMLHEKADNG
jgi:hypothetical protein